MTENGHTEVKPLAGIVPSMNLATIKLIERLKKGPIGSTVTMEELNKLTGKDCSVGGDGYGYLRTACAHVSRVYGEYVWDRVRGEGMLKCLEAEEVRGVADRTRRHVHRTSRKTVHQLNTVKLSQLDTDARVDHVARLAAFGTLTELSASKTQKKLIQKNIAKAVNMQKLLDVWVDGKETD